MSEIKEEAKSDAQSLLKSAWIIDPVALPVDPVRIARTLGIKVSVDDTLDRDVSGAIVKMGEYDPVILLNGSDARNRQRFTCAHELGHFVRRVNQGQGNFEFVDLRGTLAAAGTDPEEIYANEFAACLLMPEDMVKQYHELGYKAAQMVPYFQVSVDAMNIRLANLGLG